MSAPKDYLPVENENIIDTWIAELDEPHKCINYSQGYSRCDKQCNKCKQFD